MMSSLKKSALLAVRHPRNALALATLGASGAAFAQGGGAPYDCADPPMRPSYVMAKFQGPAPPKRFGARRR